MQKNNQQRNAELKRNKLAMAIGLISAVFLAGAAFADEIVDCNSSAGNSTTTECGADASAVSVDATAADAESRAAGNSTTTVGGESV